jgi:hypothetical protein
MQKSRRPPDSAYKHTNQPRSLGEMIKCEQREKSSKHERMNEQFLTLMMFSMQFHTARMAKK